MGQTVASARDSCIHQVQKAAAFAKERVTLVPVPGLRELEALEGLMPRRSSSHLRRLEPFLLPFFGKEAITQALLRLQL